MAEALCVIEGCEKPLHNKTHGWCEMHYFRHRRCGSPFLVRRPGRKRFIDDMRAYKRAFESARRARRKQQFLEHVDAHMVLQRDLGLCGICGEQIEGAFHLDHIVPLSRGGAHSYANMQLAHPGCNRKKWANMPALPGGGCHR